MKIELIPFQEEMIPTAGKLLAERHKQSRKSLPCLPVRFENPQVGIEAVKAVWQKKFKYGYAAFRNDRMIAYLIGENPEPLFGAFQICVFTWICAR